MKFKKTDKKGLSAFAWVLLGVSMMFIMFIPVDVALQSVQSHEFNGVLDNAVASAITNIDEELVKTGEVRIDHEGATRAVYEALATAYNLDYTGSGTNYSFKESSLKDSKLEELPYVEVQIVDMSRDETRNGVIKKTKPFKTFDADNTNDNDGYEYKDIQTDTVVIRVVAKFPSQILSRRDGFTFDRISAAQVELSDIPK